MVRLLCCRLPCLCLALPNQHGVWIVSLLYAPRPIQYPSAGWWPRQSERALLIAWQARAPQNYARERISRDPFRSETATITARRWRVSSDELRIGTAILGCPGQTNFGLLEKGTMGLETDDEEEDTTIPPKKLCCGAVLACKLSDNHESAFKDPPDSAH